MTTVLEKLALKMDLLSIREDLKRKKNFSYFTVSTVIDAIAICQFVAGMIIKFIFKEKKSIKNL